MAFLLLSVMAASVSSCDYNVIVCVCVLWCGCSSEKIDTVCVTVCVVVFACGATRNAGSVKFLYYFSASK